MIIFFSFNFFVEVGSYWEKFCKGKKTYGFVYDPKILGGPVLQESIDY